MSKENGEQTEWFSAFLDCLPYAEQGDWHLLENYLQGLRQVLLVKVSLNPQNSPLKEPLPPPFYRYRNQDSESDKWQREKSN